MSFLGVSIDCASQNSSKVSTSGTKICEHYILTHATIIWHIVKKYVNENLRFIFEKKNFKGIEEIFFQKIIECNSKFSVVFPSNLDSEYISQESVKNTSSSWEETPNFSVEAYVEEVIVSPSLFYDFLDLLLSKCEKWKFEKSEKNKIKTDKCLEIVYLSTFLILRTKYGGNIKHCFNQFETLTSAVCKGTTVFIDGCPFGSENARTVFLNSLSKGIISNINYSGNIILTDARCIIGCEGAPSYSLDDKYCVCGIVLSPFCWLKGEWVGLTFLAAIKPLVTYIQQNSESSNCAVHPFSTCSLDHILVSGSESSLQLDDETLSFTPSHVIKEARLVPDLVSVISKGIVRILPKGSSEWGTGIVIEGTKGLVVTCAHVTRGAANKAVVVLFWDGERLEGDVIFESDSGPKEVSRQVFNFNVWDLAVVQVPVQLHHGLCLSKELPQLGTPVLIGGHALFGPEALFAPTFALGNLAKVSRFLRRKRPSLKRTEEELSTFASSLRGLVCSEWRRCSLSDDEIPIALQTTCAVYNGVSGGPVVALHPAKGAVVIGVVSCCARDVNSRVSFPHVNLATPAFLVSEALDSFDRFGDWSVLDSSRLEFPWKRRIVTLRSKL